MTAAQLPQLLPAADEVSAAIGVASLEAGENEALTQAFEGIDLPAGLEWYAYSYSAGDSNADADWSAVGVLLVLVPTESDAVRLLDDLTVGDPTADRGWSEAEIGGAAAARVQQIGPNDSFTGDVLVARSGTLLIDLFIIGAADVARAGAAQSLVEGVVKRAAQAGE
ncbi:MAG: hypothetical protein O2895_00295 [Chloroflexi bacterium]|nr:hypothetical protein [Chloroflexota bacterium]